MISQQAIKSGKSVLSTAIGVDPSCDRGLNVAAVDTGDKCRDSDGNVRICEAGNGQSQAERTEK